MGNFFGEEVNAVEDLWLNMVNDLQTIWLQFFGERVEQHHQDYGTLHPREVLGHGRPAEDAEAEVVKLKNEMVELEQKKDAEMAELEQKKDAEMAKLAQEKVQIGADAKRLLKAEQGEHKKTKAKLEETKAKLKELEENQEELASQLDRVRCVPLPPLPRTPRGSSFSIIATTPPPPRDQNA